MKQILQSFSVVNHNIDFEILLFNFGFLIRRFYSITQKNAEKSAIRKSMYKQNHSAFDKCHQSTYLLHWSVNSHAGQQEFVKCSSGNTHCNKAEGVVVSGNACNFSNIQKMSVTIYYLNDRIE